MPEREELPARLDTVLDAIYAAFAEGWTDPLGTDAARRELTEEALFLARLVNELLPDTAETMGLLALMLHTDARKRARRSADGEFVPFAEQDQVLWDWERIAEAEALIQRAASLGSIGRYPLEAALQSAHVFRARTGQPNWTDVVQIYDALLSIAPSAVVALNRAVAVAEADGPAAGLAILDALAEGGGLEQYQPYWAARAELLMRSRSLIEAGQAYDKAIGLERDPAVRSFLQRRRSAGE